MKEPFEVQITKSGFFPGNIFALPVEKQNQYLKEALLKNNLLRPVMDFMFPDAGKVKVSVYFPYTTRQLLEQHDRQTVHVLDMIYSMLVARRVIITIKTPDKVYQEHLIQSDVMPDALLCMFFEDYIILPQHIKDKFQPVNPAIYLQSELN